VRPNPGSPGGELGRGAISSAGHNKKFELSLSEEVLAGRGSVLEYREKLGGGFWGGRGKSKGYYEAPLGRQQFPKRITRRNDRDRKSSEKG